MPPIFAVAQVQRLRLLLRATRLRATPRPRPPPPKQRPLHQQQAVVAHPALATDLLTSERHHAF